MKIYRRLFIGVLAFLFVGGMLSAQSLLDNEEFRRARELQQQAQEAFDAGEYERSIELSEEAEEASLRGRDIAEQRRDGFRAANARTIARDRLSTAESLNIRNEFPDIWDEAQAAYDQGQEQYDSESFIEARSSFLSVRDEIITDEVLGQLRRIGGLRIEAAEARGLARTRLNRAETLDIEREFPDVYEEALAAFESADGAYDNEQWQESRDGFRSILDIIDADMLAELQDRQRAREAAAEEAEEEVADLPGFYIVRRIPERRDSFWRIAEYEFIYDNPWEWQRIYEANRDLLQDPDNPDLIQPGMRFRIPPLEGETRSGTWNPEDAR
ncbi:MAG: LysM peptidoglycan-binding domain-containing protein [Spirochaetaceae bacterium]|nr:MAG: LysM peptidoglycan-binding domain-containing protein [Spirochaetaceae bacterium]